METTSVIPRIPVELCETIVDFYSQTPSVLINCSLVCRAWVPSTRRHLFSLIHVHDMNISLFFQLLQSPLCTISPSSIRGVQLTMFTQSLAVPSWLDDVLARSQSFKRVKTLMLDPNSLAWDSKSIVSAFSGITHLEFRDARLQSRDQFAEITHFVNQFPSLESLSLKGFHWYSGSMGYADNTLPPPPGLRALDSQVIQVQGILHWLRRAKNFTELDIRIEYGLFVLPFKECINHLSDTLTCLAVELTIDSWNKFSNLVNLSELKALRSLCLSLARYMGEEDTESDVLLYLSRIRDSSLQDIKIVLAIVPSGSWLTSVDDIFSGPHFSHLLSLEILTPKPFEGPEKRADEVMPKCSGLNILTLRQGGHLTQ
ncbi:hypothetical protein HGRIS_014619 [Hohenbuehelia grisea]|uniref:F-box domain-containing protein n=1 Tax=Hohenbuehelia grisea TaxID=104357 RepID=A0ABR3JW01_9AGAR